MSLIGFFSSMEKMVLEGRFHLLMASEGVLDISSVTGHPPSLVRDHFSSPRMVAKPYQHDEGSRSSPQRPQHPNLYRRFNCRLGHLNKTLSVVQQGKKAIHKHSRTKCSISGPKEVQ